MQQPEASKKVEQGVKSQESCDHAFQSSSNNASKEVKLENELQCKKYAQITPEIRMAFIKKVLTRQATIREASIEFGIKFSTSKAILQTFRKEGRIGKKKFRQRKSKDGLNTVSEFPTQKDIELFQKLKYEQMKDRLKENQNIDSEDFNLYSPIPAIQQRPSLKTDDLPKQPEQVPVQAPIILQPQPTAIFPFSGQQFMASQPPVYQSQYVLVSQQQLQQMQMSLNKTQMDLDYQKQLNQQLIDIIKNIQCASNKNQTQVKQEANEPAVPTAQSF